MKQSPGAQSPASTDKPNTLEGKSQRSRSAALGSFRSAPHLPKQGALCPASNSARAARDARQKTGHLLPVAASQRAAHQTPRPIQEQRPGCQDRPAAILMDTRPQATTPRRPDMCWRRPRPTPHLHPELWYDKHPQQMWSTCRRRDRAATPCARASKRTHGPSSGRRTKNKT